MRRPDITRQNHTTGENSGIYNLGHYEAGVIASALAFYSYTLSKGTERDTAVEFARIFGTGDATYSVMKTYPVE